MATQGGRAEAEKFAVAMADALGDVESLRSVGYYSPRETGTVYHREDVTRRYVDESTLEDAVLESIASQQIEQYFEDDLVGTLRRFEEKVVVYCCVAARTGVLVSLDRGDEYDVDDVFETFDRVYSRQST